MGLTAASAAYGVYGVARGGWALWEVSQLQATVQISAVPKSLNRFHSAAKSLSEVGQNNIRILRNWAKSKEWIKEPNPLGKPEKWGVLQGGKFEWRIIIKPEPGIRPELDVGSQIPRFDARVRKGTYINPFTGEKGGVPEGTHIPLEINYLGD